MNTRAYRNHRAEFAHAMAQNGFNMNKWPIDDGELHRFRVDGDKPGSKNGWYVLHPDGIPAGAYGSWRTGITHKWCARSLSTLSTLERQQCRTQQHDMHQKVDDERERRQETAAVRANELLERATTADPNHSYLCSKGIQPHHLCQSGNDLLIPLVDEHGKIWTVQRIFPNGEKRFLSGGRTKGCFALLGTLEANKIFICEGFATGATIFEQTGVTTICAMNAGNLLNVCSALTCEDRKIIICADNDHHTSNNPGLLKAREAALAINASITWPDSCGTSCLCTDFNDAFHCCKQGGSK